MIEKFVLSVTETGDLPILSAQRANHCAIKTRTYVLYMLPNSIHCFNAQFGEEFSIS